MNLLAVDTSTNLCSVALWSNQQLFSKVMEASRQHATQLVPMIDELLRDANLSIEKLDGLVFGRGPGSFTGVRISTAAIQGIALVAATPVLGVSTLQAMAFQAKVEFGLSNVIPTLDARMKQVYCATYSSDASESPDLIGEESVLNPDQVGQLLTEADLSRDWVAVGDGAEVYREEFVKCGINVLPEAGKIPPLASAMVQLAIPHFEAGHAMDAAEALPVYLRNKVALTEAERAQEAQSKRPL